MSDTPASLYYGDNLDVLRAWIPDQSIDLIYLDPPFSSNRDYFVLFRDRTGMASQAQQLGSTSQQSSQYGQLTSQIQAESQELSMLSSAVSNSIKSIGDAASTMAKKD